MPQTLTAPQVEQLTSASQRMAALVAGVGTLLASEVLAELLHIDENIVLPLLASL